MQNRFKFRTWNPDIKTFTYWGWLKNGEYKNMCSCRDMSKDELLEKYTQQCTGLKDKNDKLIYEGDIVKFAEYDWTDFSFKDWEQEKTEIVWGSGHSYPAFDLKTHNFDCNGLAYIFEEGWTIEVIGNIYENPELLEVE